MIYYIRYRQTDQQVKHVQQLCYNKLNKFKLLYFVIIDMLIVQLIRQNNIIHYVYKFLVLTVKENVEIAGLNIYSKVY